METPSHHGEDPAYPRDDDSRQRLQHTDRGYRDDEPTAMAALVTLPASQDPYGQQQQHKYSWGYLPSNPLRPEPRPVQYNASPSSVDGYPPPPPGGGHPQSQLPLMQHPGPRSPGYPPQDVRDDYDWSRQPPPHFPHAYQLDCLHSGPPAQPAQYSEYSQPQSQIYYNHPPPPGGPPRSHCARCAVLLSPAAPRQRIAIACTYCRKRKIRCSGYQSARGGKCINCSRMNQECFFRPVSSSSSTVSIPASAVPGGVPPGRPLHRAYGQPLRPGSMECPSQQHYPVGPRGNGYYNPHPAVAGDLGCGSPASTSAHGSPGGYLSSYGSSHPYDAGPPGPSPRHSPGQASFTAMGLGSEIRVPSSVSRCNNSSISAAGKSTVMSLENLDNPSMGSGHQAQAKVTEP